MTDDPGRRVLSFFRDALGLTNGQLWENVQDCIGRDKFIAWMSGNDAAITPEEGAYIGKQFRPYVEEYQSFREWAVKKAQQTGETAPPSFEEIAGTAK